MGWPGEGREWSWWFTPGQVLLDSLLGQSGDPRPRGEYGRVSLLHFSGTQPVCTWDDPTLTRDGRAIVPSQQATTQGCSHFLSFCQRHQNMLALSPTSKTLKDN